MSPATYQRLVSWAKVGLPLIALAILSTIFLFSRGRSLEDSIPFADVDVETLTREQRITAPAYAGLTRDGTAVTVAADMARPDPGALDQGTAERLMAMFDLPGGERLSAEAVRGRLDTARRAIDLDGGIRLTSSSGFEINASSLVGSLERTSLSVRGPITARGPIGELTAGQLEVTLARDAEAGGGGDAEADQGGLPRGPYLMSFTDGVRVVYTPKD